MEDINILNVNLEIPIYKNYNIKDNNNDVYDLRIEINKQNIMNFILKKLNDRNDYIYKNETKILSLVKNLNLDTTNIDKIFILFDTIYNNKNISINYIEKNPNQIKLIIKNIDLLINNTIVEIF